MKKFCFFITVCLTLLILTACSKTDVAEGTKKDDFVSKNSVTNTNASAVNSTVPDFIGMPDENISSENVSSENTSSNANSSENSSENSSSSHENRDENSTFGVPQRDPDKAEHKQWYMVLANPDNPLTKDYISSVKKGTINSAYSSNANSSKYLDERIVADFDAMCKAAKKDGVSLRAVSAYRTYNYQETLYKKRVQRVIDEEGLPEDEAAEKAATIVARPGTSEHHLGLAVDINSVETTFENTKAFKWLQENAENYGFVMRYPEDKQSITKIIYEPWHYRYVGTQNAKEMNRLGLCLEEYIEYLKTKEQ